MAAGRQLFPKHSMCFQKWKRRFFSGLGGPERPNYAAYEDSVQAIIESGQAVLINGGGGEFMDGFFFRPTPGHSPDHLSISLSSQGENALFAGDIIHLPIQIDYPELSSCFGADPERGRLSRLWALEYTVANNALFFSSHCPGSSAGRVKRNSGQFQWCFV